MPAKKPPVSIQTGIAVLTLCTSAAYFAHDLQATIQDAASDRFRGTDMDRFVERLRNAARWQAERPDTPLIVPDWRAKQYSHK